MIYTSSGQTNKSPLVVLLFSTLDSCTSAHHGLHICIKSREKQFLHLYGCAIKLLHEATSPRNQIYPLFVAEQHVMEEYIQEALQHGYSGYKIVYTTLCDVKN